MSTYNVSSGQVVSNTLVYGDVETVSSGGITQDQYNGGQRFVLSGGIVRNGVVSSGGKDYISSGGSSYQSVIQNGGIRYVYGGGTADNPFIAAGGTVSAASGANILAVNAFSGGVLSAANGAIISGGNVATGASITANSGTLLEGKISVSSGANVTNGTLTGSGATLSAYTGSIISGVSVGSGTRLYLGSGATGSTNLVNGGTLEIASGASPSNNRFGDVSGGTIIIDSGSTWSNNNNATYGVTSGNKLVVNNGGTVSGTVIYSGGTTIISSGGVVAGTQTVSSGGTLVLNGTAGSGVVSLSGDGAHLVINGTTMPSNIISGWSPTDTIDLTSIPKSSITSVTITSTGITFYTNNGNYSLNVPDANKYGYTFSSDSNGGVVYTTCFAEGTLITTPSGPESVENLTPGTMVMTPKGAMPVKWLGHRSITVSDQPTPEENWLVRIRAGALADGIPVRDLLVTQEHCMVFEGKLVPARMLVNDTSILIDRTINSYTYYHVELDSHEALWAEQALTESYLDTGNRDQFDNHTVTTIFGGIRNAKGSETLPLQTSRDFVEPIYDNIAVRAGKVIQRLNLTLDPDLHLITNMGQIIRPIRKANNRVIFMIPEAVQTVRLVSRANRPSDTIGPFVDDRRSLGVLVGEVILFGEGQTMQLSTHLTQSDLSGWHELESSTHRWTDGNAIFPLQKAEYFQKGQSIFSVQIISSGPYLNTDFTCENNVHRFGGV